MKKTTTKKTYYPWRRRVSKRSMFVMSGVAVLTAIVGVTYLFVAHADTSPNSTAIDSDSINTSTANFQQVDLSSLALGSTRTFYFCLSSPYRRGFAQCLVTNGSGNQLSTDGLKASPIDVTRVGTIENDYEYTFSHRGYCIKAFSNGRVEEGTVGCNKYNVNDQWILTADIFDVHNYENIGQIAWLGTVGDQNNWARVQRPDKGFFLGWYIFKDNPY